MGEKQNQPFQLSFNSSLKVDFQGLRVTSEGGLLLVRELDERLGLSELISKHLTDGAGGPAFDLCRIVNTAGAPLFAGFAKGGYHRS